MTCLSAAIASNSPDMVKAVLALGTGPNSPVAVYVGPFQTWGIPGGGGAAGGEAPGDLCFH